MTIAVPILAAVLFAARFVLMVTLHVAPSPYRPVRHAFSDYGVGPTRRLATTSSLVYAGGWAALAAAVQLTTSSWSYRTTATILLVALAVLSLIVIVVPTDLEGQRLTRRGIAHYVVAIAIFAIAYSLTGDASRWVRSIGPDWAGSTLVALHWIALAGLVGLVAGLLLRKLRPYFGALERVFLFAIVLFYLLFSIVLALR